MVVVVMKALKLNVGTVYKAVLYQIDSLSLPLNAHFV